jgi:hypothetical protein
LISTLEFFGLPKNYMDGKTGHHPEWGKDSKDGKRLGKKGPAAGKGAKEKEKRGGAQAKLKALKQQRGLGKGVEKQEKPTHFDITVLQKCLGRLVACSGEVRSNLRKALLNDINKTMKVFLDEHREQSFKKCVDVDELGALLRDKERGPGLELEQVAAENLGAILLCFGEIEHEPRYAAREPEETPDEKRRREIAEK